MAKKEVKPEVMEEDPFLDVVNPVEDSGADDTFIPGEVSESEALEVSGVRFDANGDPQMEIYTKEYPTEAHVVNKIKANTDPTIEETTLPHNSTVILRKKVKP